MITADRTVTDGRRLTISLFEDPKQQPMLEIFSPKDPLSSILINIDTALGLELLSNSEIEWLINKNAYIKSWTTKCQENIYAAVYRTNDNNE